MSSPSASPNPFLALSISMLAVQLSAPAARAAARPVHLFESLALAPDGAHVASVEYDEPARDGDEPARALVIRATATTTSSGAAVRVALPCAPGPDCKPSDLAFSPKGQLGFVLQQPHDTQRRLYEVNPDGSGLALRLAFRGLLGGLRYAPDGTAALLATPGARKEAGAVEAGAAPSGEIGIAADEQRIAVLEPDGSQGGRLHFVSPANLYVYEFDWLPDGSGFVGTAAPGNGDNQWWVARLWRFARATGEARVLYTPPPAQQLASPLVSPDGRAVAFIGGIMSDFGSTGGDAFRLSLAPGARPVDLTPGLKASITALDWGSRAGLIATALQGSETELLALGERAAPRRLWSGPESLETGGWNLSVRASGGLTAAIRQDFTHPPEIVVGPVGGWRALTVVNQGLTIPVSARSLTWRSDGFDAQGWLLQPRDHPGGRPLPMITEVHGGPSAAITPRFLSEEEGLWLLRAGYALFEPNPRGSFGQGEAFTRANRRDFGYGDSRDILRGVDAALAAAPIDAARLGLTGYSYGGYMTMWMVTQTDRFKAAVAGAGVANWQSYYGQNGIDEWMIPFFGASVYADPAIYAHSSPISFIRRVRTPTFVYVGDRDLECPMPQSQEFWHALHTLGVPTQFVVYPGQGHALRDAADRADAKRRTLAWFDRWLTPATPPARPAHRPEQPTRTSGSRSAR